eukprot:m.27398 g.27398  ORF g.27398 m.27398 type:complete len:1012 (-) comp7890_c0_seq1:27-3062(-)
MPAPIDNNNNDVVVAMDVTFEHVWTYIKAQIQVAVNQNGPQRRALLVAIFLLVFLNSVSRAFLLFVTTILGAAAGVVLIRSPHKKKDEIADEKEKENPQSPTEEALVCVDCGQENCSRHLVKKPPGDYTTILINEEFNKVIEDMINLTIEVYIRPWYASITDDEIIVNQLRYCLKSLSANFYLRLCQLDVGAFLHDTIVPVIMRHIQTYIHAKRVLKNRAEGRNVYDLALLMLKGKHHIGLHNEDKYFRPLFASLLPYMFAGDIDLCPSTMVYIREMLLSSFKPMLDFWCEPYLFNSQVLLLIEPVDEELPPCASDQLVPILSDIDTPLNPDSIFELTVASMVDPKRHLQAFQKFMSDRGTINELLCFLELLAVFESLGSKEERIAMVQETFKNFIKNSSSIGLPNSVTEKIQNFFSLDEEEKATTAITLAKDLLQLIENRFQNVHRPLFAASEAYLKDLCKGRVQRPSTIASPPHGKKKGKKALKTSEYDILALGDLPLPPSAVEEHHPNLVQMEEKKKRFSLKNLRIGKGKSEKDVSVGAVPIPECSNQSSEDENQLLPSSLPNDSGAALSMTPPGTSQIDMEKVSKPRAATMSCVLPSSDTQDVPVVSEEVSPPPQTVSPYSYSISGVEARIYKWEKRHKGSRQYVSYILHVTQTNKTPEEGTLGYGQTGIWTVERRYNEFAACEKKLNEFYTGLKVDLPEKRAFGNLDKEHIERRRRALNGFLSELLGNPLIHTDPRCTELLYWFLHPSDENNFKNLSRPSTSISSKFALRKIVPEKTERETKELQLASFVDAFIVTAEDLLEDINSSKAAQASQEPEEKKPLPTIEETIWNTEMPAQEIKEIAKNLETPSSLTIPHERSIDSVFALVIELATETKLEAFIWHGVALCQELFGKTVDNQLQKICVDSMKFENDFILSQLRYVRDMSFSTEVAPLPTDKEKEKMERDLKIAIKKLIPKIMKFTGIDVELCVDAFQDKTFNKQLILTLLDVTIKKLFPEIPEKEENSPK